LVNGVFWAMEMEVPENANVDLVGKFNPSQYGFKEDEFWKQKQLKIVDLK